MYQLQKIIKIELKQKLVNGIKNQNDYYKDSEIKN